MGVCVGVGLNVVVGPGTNEDQKLLSFIQITASGISVIPDCLVIAWNKSNQAWSVYPSVLQKVTEPVSGGTTPDGVGPS